MNPDLDHIILGCRDLEEGIAYIEKLSGYRAAFGGCHVGRGTQNALLKMGQGSYLEILAPDPNQDGPRWHTNIVELTEPALIGWALKASGLEALAVSFRKRGILVAGPTAGSRTTPDGDVLRWSTLSHINDREGILPFYIEWDRTSKHPAENAPGACLLLEFQDAGQLRASLAGRKGKFELSGSSIRSEFPAAQNSPVR